MNPTGFPAETCATMGTAANMNNAALIAEEFRNLMVVAVVTGGVETNAGRAGDPASVFETADGFETLPPSASPPGPGTINTMVLINKPLIPGAMVRTIMTATEAKSAALQELAVNSRYSDGSGHRNRSDHRSRHEHRRRAADQCRKACQAGRVDRPGGILGGQTDPCQPEPDLPRPASAR